MTIIKQDNTYLDTDYPFVTVKVIADSCDEGLLNRLTTVEAEYPRYIHAEVMTHRQLSRNAQSSRAVPVNKTVEINDLVVKPIKYGKNKAGMSSTEELTGLSKFVANLVWNTAAYCSFTLSKALSKLGLHKQWANRLTEPFSKIKVVISATEWANFLWLRDDEEAVQPEFYLLAKMVNKAISESVPEVLANGEWHTPYVKHNRDTLGVLHYVDSDGNELTLGEAKYISASCSAQVSYRNLNDSKEKALDIYNKLFSGPKPHMSPTEHQGTPIDITVYEQIDFPSAIKQGLTHIDVNENLWSGNFKGFHQYRQTIGK